jgi:hypothetical protein
MARDDDPEGFRWLGSRLILELWQDTCLVRCGCNRAGHGAEED